MGSGCGFNIKRGFQIAIRQELKHGFVIVCRDFIFDFSSSHGDEKEDAPQTDLFLLQQVCQALEISEIMPGNGCVDLDFETHLTSSIRCSSWSTDKTRELGGNGRGLRQRSRQDSQPGAQGRHL